MAEALLMAELDGVLAELQALSLEAAREMQARMLAAEDSKATADYSLAFSRSFRSVRQTVALRAKLSRERKRGDREDRDDAQRQGAEEVTRRRKLVRIAVDRLIWTEGEGQEVSDLLVRLEDRLEEAGLSGVLAEGSIEAHIERIRQDLGLGAKPSEPPEPEPIPKPPAKATRKRRKKPARQPDVIPFDNLRDDPWRDWRAGYDPSDEALPPEAERPGSG